MEYSLSITCAFDVAVDELYRAWTDPRHHGAWMAPPPWSVDHVRMDVRSGGEYEIVTKADDGSVFTFVGRYVSVIPNERLESVGDLIGPEGKKLMSQIHTLRTFRVVEPRVTEQTLLVSGFKSEEEADAVRSGWEHGGLKELEAFLNKKYAGA